MKYGTVTVLQIIYFLLRKSIDVDMEPHYSLIAWFKPPRISDITKFKRNSELCKILILNEQMSRLMTKVAKLTLMNLDKIFMEYFLNYMF